MKVIIIDDDKTSRLTVGQHLKKMEDIEIIAEFESAVEANAKLKNYNFDFLLLDIEMPDMSGLDYLSSLDKVPPVILMSSHREFGAEAFDNNVIDYVVKPVAFPRLMKAINKVKDLLATTIDFDPNAGFFIKTDGVLKKVKYKDIVYVEALGDYVMVHTELGEFKVHATMKKMVERLMFPFFIRVHRSYIVRKDRIDKIDIDIIEVNKKLIPVGRSYKNNLFDAIDIL